VWLTPHPRDLIQPEGERERMRTYCTTLCYSWYIVMNVCRMLAV